MENDKISKIFDNRITLITCVTNNPTKRLGVLQVINGKI